MGPSKEEQRNRLKAIGKGATLFQGKAPKKVIKSKKKKKFKINKREFKFKSVPKLKPIEIEDYSLFLKSPYWKYVRKMVLKRDDNRCRRCGSDKMLQVHHKSYKFHLQEHKHLENLITLCRKCHRAQHPEKRYLRSNK